MAEQTQSTAEIICRQLYYVPERFGTLDGDSLLDLVILRDSVAEQRAALLPLIKRYFEEVAHNDPDAVLAVGYQIVSGFTGLIQNLKGAQACFIEEFRSSIDRSRELMQSFRDFILSIDFIPPHIEEKPVAESFDTAEIEANNIKKILEILRMYEAHGDSEGVRIEAARMRMSFQQASLSFSQAQESFAAAGVCSAVIETAEIALERFSDHMMEWMDDMNQHVAAKMRSLQRERAA